MPSPNVVGVDIVEAPNATALLVDEGNDDASWTGDVESNDRFELMAVGSLLLLLIDFAADDDVDDHNDDVDAADGCSWWRRRRWCNVDMDADDDVSCTEGW